MRSPFSSATRLGPLPFGALVFALCALASRADVQVIVDHIPADDAEPGFKFPRVPPPSASDAATKAAFTLVRGRADANSAGLDVLHDGKLPSESDQPAANFFFADRTPGGRLLVDLGDAVDLRQVNTYSWHPGSRSPQVYELYARASPPGDSLDQLKQGADPEKSGWRLLARVDTRTETGLSGGQLGVSVSDSAGGLGKFQYLLFDISRAKDSDPFGNTFFAEIDVVDRNSHAAEIPATSGVSSNPNWETFPTADEKYQFSLDVSETPDLSDWARRQLVPAVKEWYPKLVKLLPSEGFEAPRKFSIQFIKDKEGVADTSGARIRCAADWTRQNLKGEAIGSIVHEMAHVVQQYGASRRPGPLRARSPGWLTEGIPDYIRWYLYEPQSHGAEIAKSELPRARYDASYRTSANFLNWVIERYDKDLIRQLNAALRDRSYSDDLWVQLTGHSVQDLGREWKTALEKESEARAGAAEPNVAPAPR